MQRQLRSFQHFFSCANVFTLGMLFGLSAGIPFTGNVTPSRFTTRLRENRDKQPLEEGFIDITKPPYNAVGDGINDDSDAIQNAIDDAYANNLVVFFPAGTYLVSKQLRCIQNPMPIEGSTSQRKFGHILVGSTKGERSPVIKLKDGCRLNGQILLFEFRGKDGKADPSRHYIATLRGIDIDSGDNPDITVLSMAGAQHCVIEDVTIYGDFYIGIENLPGSGGGLVNVRIIGGRIGILQDQFRPDPTITGLSLENQRQCGIKLLNSRGPLVVTGFRIIGPDQPGNDYCAVYAYNPFGHEDGTTHALANLCLTDGTIEVKGRSPKAIYNFAQDVVIKNVYFKAQTIIESGAKNPPAKVVYGDSAGWKKIDLYYFASSDAGGSIHIDGKEMGQARDDIQYCEPLIDEEPGEDYRQMHVWGDMPSWEDDNIINVVTDYGATPEYVQDSDDDSDAIQKAIEDSTTPGNINFGKTVFIPRGHFHLKKPILLKKGVKVIGAGKNISVLQLDKDWQQANGAAVNTVNIPDGDIILSDIAILGYPCLPLLHISSGDTIIRDVVTEALNFYGPQNGVPGRPYVLFSGNAGGKVYHLSLDHITLWDKNINKKRIENYHLVKVENTLRSLSFYQLSVEHLNNSPQVMLQKATDVHIYGFKFEHERELLHLIAANNINVIGGAGNYGICDPEDEGIIVMRDCHNIFFCNLNRKATPKDIRGKSWLVDGVQTVSDERDMVVYLKN